MCSLLCKSCEPVHAHRHITVAERLLLVMQRHCSAPYKAPELYDVPSECELDERVDIWSLGALL